MNRKPTFYITTTLPYVNAEPHIGFAMEIIRADIIARYKKLSGFDVFFNTGTDEHGLKIYRKAREEGKNPQVYVDEYAEKFKNLKSLLGLSEDISFIRTTDPKHVSAAQEFWRRCRAAGYIYKKNYKIKYCVGCELEKTDSELLNGRCSIHPNLALEIIAEENYFFAFSKFQKPLLEFYEKHPNFVVPDSRYGEIKAFVSRGLEDFSISRLAAKMPWGVVVPDDKDHVMYVWFEALVSYISTLGWPINTETFEKFWLRGNPTQYCGKDNLRQQSAMWQAMLMAAGLPNSHQIVIDGFINSGGQKMSKSRGNVIDPVTLVREYGTDALRYYVARELHPFEDSDFTVAKFKEAYNANLANGLGNLASRIMKMVEAHLPAEDKAAARKAAPPPPAYIAGIGHYDLKSALDVIFSEISTLDKKIQNTEPFKLIRTEPEKAKKIIADLRDGLGAITDLLLPFLPETAKRISETLVKHESFSVSLFPRKE